jgi:hypothetical protein
VIPDAVPILYDPVGYYRPWRHSQRVLHPLHRAGLNEFLVRHYALPPWSALASCDVLLSLKLIKAWQRVERIALLLACAKNAKWLIAQRCVLALPPDAHMFMRLGFQSEINAPIPSGAAFDDLIAWGGQYLLRTKPMLPPWLAARMMLPFVGLDRVEMASSVKPDMTCLWMAINHASNYSGSCDSFGY